MNMSKVKVIPQKYLDKIAQNNPDIVLLSTTYVNLDSVVDAYCKKHNVFYHKALKYMIKHSGCPECTKEIISNLQSYTTDEFKEIVKLKNPHIEILGEYTRQGCRILCRCLKHNVEFYTSSQTLTRGKGGCPICNSERGHRTPSEELKEHFHKLNPTLIIIDENIRLDTWVKVYCIVCKQYFYKMLTHAYIKDKKSTCSVCTNRTIVRGYNDVATTRPDLVEYFKDKEDAYKYGQGMTKKLVFVCPHCGYEKELRIEVLARQGFGCPCCGDGISYPNKFIRSLIRQLNVENVCFEYSPHWAKGYFYDCYFEYEDKKYIIEVDGQQHFKKASNFEMTLEETQKRDKEKTTLAEENGCVLIRIDAQKSNKDYLLHQITNSLLSELFDLNLVNWEKCDLDATSNLAKEVCLYAEKVMPDKYKNIIQHFNLSEDTIRSYLKQGVEYGWCSRRLIEKLTVPKKVSVYNMDDDLLYIFNGIRECSDEMSKICGHKFSKISISNSCHGTRSDYKGYIFKFTYNTI